MKGKAEAYKKPKRQRNKEKKGKEKKKVEILDERTLVETPHERIS